MTPRPVLGGRGGGAAGRRPRAWASRARIKTPGPRIVFRRRYGLYYLLNFLEGWRKQIFLCFAGFLLVKLYDVDLLHMFILQGAVQAIGWVVCPRIGRLIDRVGERRVLGLYYVLMVAVFLGYVLSTNRYVLCGLYVVDGTFFFFAMALTTYAGSFAAVRAHGHPERGRGGEPHCRRGHAAGQRAAVAGEPAARCSCSARSARWRAWPRRDCCPARCPRRPCRAAGSGTIADWMSPTLARHLSRRVIQNNIGLPVDVWRIRGSIGLHWGGSFDAGSVRNCYSVWRLRKKRREEMIARTGMAAGLLCVLFASQAGQGAIVSTFDTDLDGWSMVKANGTLQWERCRRQP